MKQQFSYKNDITREIDGVIKAESDKRLCDEITEYVVTAEQRREPLLPKLFKGLREGGPNNCVWISGDFGSGKSHLLKILSYVLQNSLEIDGVKCAQIFANKCNDDFELKKAIEDACKVPTTSILFNIQKNLDAIASSSVDPVLMIFLKVFNSKLGYDDKKPGIAEIERYIASKGKYDWFKSEYRSRYGVDWETERPQILLQLQKLAAIFADMEGIDKATAYNNLDRQIKQYTIDNGGFVDLVKNYLDENPGTRLIFFADEVGQFIGKDISRMLSLQTLAEELDDKTNGRSSIMVTSQMDIDAAIGNLDGHQKHDFSRIQARFSRRINLTSANADEVIQRRLLEKKPEVQEELEREYDKQRNVINSLFQFGEDSKFRNRYKSAQEFATDLPFVDYQFDLIQQSVINLSKNNAFSGEQNSVGERSLLAVTHLVANKYKDCDFSHIVQFSDMYEGIRDQLQAKIQNDIIQAEKTLDDDLALKVLKTLFLLKYVEGFPTTVENVTKILLPSFDTDFPEFKSKIQEALNKLMRQSYIDKGAKGDYHFQTNEEKDIENEIKNQDLAPDAINKELMKMFRDEIFSENKIKLSANKIFPYGRIVDDEADGLSDINIHFVTGNSGLNAADNQSMIAYSFQRQNQLCVVLAEDKYLIEDLVMFKKADKCLSRLLQNSEGYRLQIVSDKRRINNRRRENIIERLKEATKSASLFIRGQEVDVRATDLKARLNEAMANLVMQVYTNLEMLEIDYTDDMLKRIIAEQNIGFWDGTMDACMSEVFNKITRNKNQSIRTKVSDLVADFKKGTYGWYELATLSILAKLYKLDKISFRNGGTLVEGRYLYSQLTNSNSRQTLIVDIEETITNAQVATLKNQYRDLFDDESCFAQGAKDVHNAFAQRLNDEILKIRNIIAENKFEFTKPLEEVVSKLTSLSRLVYPGLYSKKEEIEDVIDLKEDIVEPITQFIGSRQFDIFKSLNNIMTGNQANLAYVDQTLMDNLRETYKSDKPWNKMSDAKGKLDEVRQIIEHRQTEERQKALVELDSKYEAIKNFPAFPTLKSQQAAQIESVFELMRKVIQEERFIGNLIAYMSRIADRYNTCLDSINRWVDEANQEAAHAAAAATAGNSDTGTGSTGTGAGNQITHKVKKAVTKEKALSMSYPKRILETKEDVERYIDSLRTRLLDYIDKDTNIMLN